MKTKLTKQQIFDLQFKYDIKATPSIMKKKNWWNHIEYWRWIFDTKSSSIPEEFFRMYINVIDELGGYYWEIISRQAIFSEDFIREFQDKVYWEGVSSIPNLSEDFIREFQDKVYWWKIFDCQTLSDEFIEEFKDKYIDEDDEFDDFLEDDDY